MKLALSEVVAVTGGAAAGGSPEGDPVLGGVAYDSREAKEGDLFVALRGTVRDGHEFVGDAFARGARAALVSEAALGLGPGVQVVVDDPMAALTRLARHVRDTVDPFVVGITGSVGKTTTKDFAAAVLARRFSTVASHRSFNNDLGVPLTLLAVDPLTEVVVCELGARGAGHIAALCRYVRPHVGVVTNVGVTHYAEFGSREAIAREKGVLVRCLPETGAAVLNADDPVVLAMAADAPGDVVTFGMSAGSYVRADEVELDWLGRPAFRIRAGKDSAWVKLPTSGRHQVSNALAAAATGVALGVPLDEAATGLSAATLSPWRMEVHERRDGVVVVNDAYNASPASMVAALESSAAIAGERPGRRGRLIAVLGYMAELGGIEEAEHERVGGLAAALADEVVVVEDRAAGIAVGALAEGGSVRSVPDAAGAVELLDQLGLHEGDVVLVKASRVAGLESVAEVLLPGVRA